MAKQITHSLWHYYLEHDDETAEAIAGAAYEFMRETLSPQER